jgi:hypothetical protein
LHAKHLTGQKTKKREQLKNVVHDSGFSLLSQLVLKVIVMIVDIER